VIALATHPVVHEAHVRLGFRSAGCEACYPPPPAPEPQSWHDQARAGQLRPSIVGGVPITTSAGPAPGAPSLDLSPQVLTRRVPRSAGAPQSRRPGGPAGRPASGDSDGSRSLPVAQASAAGSSAG
jgi:hypothetical protein